MSARTKKAAAKTPEADAASAKNQASLMTHAGINAAAIIEKFGAAAFGEPGIDMIVESVVGKIEKVQDGSLHGCEAMLMGQAMALQSMFVSLSRRAATQDYLKQYETYLRLALKAQSQCRATLETLAAIKNPPVVFARQANIAHGPQQVNNGIAASHGGKNNLERNELLEASHEQPLDTRTTCQTIEGDTAALPMVEVHRPAQH